MGAALPPPLPALVLLQSQPTFYAAWEDARDAERRGRYPEALGAYRRAAELRPRSSAQVIIYGNNLLEGYYPYTRIARCCLELGRWEEAEQALARAGAEGEPAAERLSIQAGLQAARSRVAASHPAPAAIPSQAAPFREPSPPLPAPSRPAPVEAVQAEAPAPLARPQSAEPSPVPPPQGSGANPPRPRVLPEAAEPSRAVTLPAAPAPPPQPTAATLRKIPWLLGGSALALAGAFLLGRRRRPRPGGPPGQPERIGPYRVERLLGRGGFAATYLARRPGNGPPVALKLLHAYRRDDPEFLRRFRQEAQLGSRLDHPGIVRILDQGLEEDLPWIAMEYVQGRSLAEELKLGGPMPLARALDLARQVAGAMTHAHDKGVVHRDLKPSNVMIVGKDVKVMDFGIARTQDSETLTTTYAFLGTPQYAAPELQTRTRVGPEVDRYAFGILLFEMVAGRPPFQGETPFEILDQHRNRDLPDLAALVPGTPAVLVDLVRRLAAKDPALRPGDAEILEVLARL